MDRRARLIVLARRPPFGRHGRTVIVAGCAYEILALLDPVPLPTISELVRRHPVVGVALLALLGQHFWLEDAEWVAAALGLEAAVEALTEPVALAG